MEICILFPEINLYSQSSTKPSVPKNNSRSRRRRLNKKAKQRSLIADEDVKSSDAPPSSSNQVRAPPPELRLLSKQPPLAPPVSYQDKRPYTDNPSGVAGIPDFGEPNLPAMELVSEKKRKALPSFSYG